MTGAVDGAGHAYHSGAPDVTSGPVFRGGSYCKCFSFCVVLFMYILILCALLFLCFRPFCRVHVCYLDFALIAFCRFLIIPLPCSFGILLPIREPFSRHTNIYSVIEDTFHMCYKR
jgi:hypothetical protein